jgi:hypothetical protein
MKSFTLLVAICCLLPTSRATAQDDGMGLSLAAGYNRYEGWRDIDQPHYLTVGGPAVTLGAVYLDDEFVSVELELKYLYNIHFEDNARVGDPSVDSYAEQGFSYYPPIMLLEPRVSFIFWWERLGFGGGSGFGFYFDEANRDGWVGTVPVFLLVQYAFFIELDDPFYIVPTPYIEGGMHWSYNNHGNGPEHGIGLMGMVGLKCYFMHLSP